MPYFFIRLAVEDFSTSTIIFARVVIGAAVLIPLAIKRNAFLPALKAWPWVLAFALIEMVGPWWLITEAERYISSGLAGLLISVVPFFAVLIAYFFQGDKSVKHPKTVFGLVVGFLGVVLLVGIDSLTGFAEPLWVGATILAALGYAIGGVDFGDLAIELKAATVDAAGTEIPAVLVKYGAFIQTVVDFVIIALAIFVAVKVMNSLKRKEAASPEPPPAPSEEVKLLTEIRDSLTSR